MWEAGEKEEYKWGEVVLEGEHVRLSFAGPRLEQPMGAAALTRRGIEVLRGWIRPEVEELLPDGRREVVPNTVAHRLASEALYALSRVLSSYVEGFTGGAAKVVWKGERIALGKTRYWKCVEESSNHPRLKKLVCVWGVSFKLLDPAGNPLRSGRLKAVLECLQDSEPKEVPPADRTFCAIVHFEGGLY